MGASVWTVGRRERRTGWEQTEGRLGHPGSTVCVAPKAVYCPTAGGGGPGGGSSLAGSYSL